MSLHHTLIRKAHFSCGHKYENLNWSDQKNIEVFGPCYSEFGHGHNYFVEFHINAPVCPDTGMTINLTDADAVIAKVVNQVDHKHLNFDLEYFKTVVPTTENIAQFLFENSQQEFELFNASLKKVVLYEDENLWVECSER